MVMWDSSTESINSVSLKTKVGHVTHQFVEL